MVKACKGRKVKLGPTGVWRFTSQGAQPRRARLDYVPTRPISPDCD